MTLLFVVRVVAHCVCRHIQIALLFICCSLSESCSVAGCCIYRHIVSIRDLLAWVEFICHTTNDTKPEVESELSELLVSRPMKQLDLSAAYVHGACIVFVDALVTSGQCQ